MPKGTNETDVFNKWVSGLPFFFIKHNKVKCFNKKILAGHSFLFLKSTSNKRPFFLWRQWIIDLLSLNLTTMIWQTKKFVEQLILYLWENLWKSIQKRDNFVPSTFHYGKNFSRILLNDFLTFVFKDYIGPSL